MLVECVPNFSEGRRPEVIDALSGAVRGIPGARLLDVQSDASHNRTVITFAGEPIPVKLAAFATAKRAVELIDLNTHTGEHPRMGALDVLPFVPLEDAELYDCVSIARDVGTTLGKELNLPVFLYEAAARRSERRNLADIRNKHQFEGLREQIGHDPAWTPDFGPEAIHPTAGCVAVGARMPLIAYNIDLDGEDAGVAKKIAKKIRERDGGLPGIKALGLHIAERACAQVSMNVCNYSRTSLLTVFRAVAQEAQSLGIGIRSSEVVGLLPAEAIRDEWIQELKLEGFTPNQIIENRLRI